jgi:hypothetical protein
MVNYEKVWKGQTHEIAPAVSILTPIATGMPATASVKREANENAAFTALDGRERGRLR